MKSRFTARWRLIRRRVTSHPWARFTGIWLRGWPQKPFCLFWLGRRLSTAEIGQMGEWIAARWLRGEGRKILRRNFRGVSRGEIDIVARHGGALTFVEVKTRTSRGHGRPADNVGPDKQRLMMRGAHDWLRELDLRPVRFRFDIAEVTLIPGEIPQVHIIENAFQLPDSAMAGR
ncbi:MAG: YraN family protein [Verrucomicrobiaceae bacterium]|nr:YraN family protein [Verrucomicrobiaceae bacterium]